VVSICTWPSLHAEMAIAAAEAGVRAIHCEKPMAPTWGEARRMAQAARARGATLIFSHQRRFEAQFRAARRLLGEGAIGELLGMECHCSNLFDWGTHWFDIMNFYNGDTDVRWVMGQVDLREGRRVFGALVEDQGLSHFRYANGVWGLLVTGPGAGIGCSNRLIGREGVIEVGVPLGEGRRVPVRVKGRGDAEWRVPDISGDGPGPRGSVAAATADMLRCLEAGGEPELSATKALRATELIFATYESARRRARVDLPLEIDDSPLVDLFARGEIGQAAPR
jgi:UDP-N-acetylglucosamine 3-dehydrogenase